jgi:hypothetical protein
LKRYLSIALGMSVACSSAQRMDENTATADTVATAPSNSVEVSIRELVNGAVQVGKVVRTHGQCIGYSKPVAQGPPPRTRSDWQLEDGGIAIWVVGAFPPGCTGAGGDGTRITVSGSVAEDTVVALNGRGHVRRFLIR